MKRIWAQMKVWLHKFINIILGDIQLQWKAPRWMGKVHEHRKRVLQGLGALIVVGAAGYGIKYYLDSLPKPEYCKYEITPPPPTDLEKNLVHNLVIRFQCSAAPVSSLGKTLVEAPELSPKISGSWKWESDKRLVFTPSGDPKTGEWLIGKTFTVYFPKKKFLADHILLENYKPEFATDKIRYYVTKKEFYIDPTNTKIKKAVLNLGFNYPIDAEDFKKHVQFYYNSRMAKNLGSVGSKFAFTVSFNKLLNEAYLTSDVIPVPADESVMTIEIEKGFSSTKAGEPSDQGEKHEVTVPGRSDTFKITSAQVTFARNERYEPEQVLIVSSSIDAKSADIAKNMKVYVLPRYKDEPKEETKNRYDYWSVGDVTQAVLAKSKAVTFETMPTEQETSRTHSFKVQVPPRYTLYVEVRKGIRALDEYELVKDYLETIKVPEYPRELTIMSEGALLSLRGEQKLPVLSRNVNQIELHLYKLIPDQLNQLMRNVFSGGRGFAKPYIYSEMKDSASEAFEETIALHPEKAAKTHYFSVDLGKYLSKGVKKKGLFYLEIRDKDNQNTQDKRFVLLTDLGVIAKKTALKTHEIYVQSLSTGQPVVGATVELMGMNGIALFEVQTDGNGHAEFPDVSQLKNEKAPSAFVVRKDGDLSFIPFESYERQLSYSKYEVGGLYEQATKDEITSMIFSDRSLYRPGEKINLALMARSKNGKRSFKDVPLTWNLTDPRGSVVKTGKMLASSTELKDLELQTGETWYTGTYIFTLSLVKDKNQQEVIGNTEVRVEEFLPDQMKISSHLSKEKAEGWVHPKDLKASVTLKNLFGTPAENRRIEATITVMPFQPRFTKLKDYHFVSLNKKDETDFHAPLSEAETDSKGEASYDLDLNQFNAGMYRLRFEAKGFDASGGRSVVSASTVLISPLPYLVGLKPDGELTYIKKGADRNIDLLAVDSDLKNIDVKDLKLQIIERRYVSVLTQNSDGTYKYQSVLKEIPGEEKKMIVTQKGARYKVVTSVAGEFTLVVKNSGGTEINRMDYSVMAEGNLARSLDKNAELQVALSKADYNPGEEIELQVKAPYTGAGLITIERDRVYAAKWFKTNTTTSIMRIKIPEGLEGNAYVNVTFLRSLDSKEIFTSPLSYSVSPFAISLDSHRTKLSLEAPSLVKPGQKLKVKYSASRKTPMVLWGVDEGILLVARYKEPKPLDFFFQKRALQVTTWQILDLLLPEFSIVKESAGVGGDEAGALGRNLNPFKRKSNPPVVFWSGVLDAGPEAKEFSVDIPDYYNGNIKIFAVAATEQAYGNESTASLIRGDFVITPTAPLAISPGDEFELGVGVSNQASGTGDKAQVKVELQSSEYFQVLDERNKTVTIAEGHEGELIYKVKATNKLGSGKMTLTASAGGKSAKYAFDSSVRPSVVYKSDVKFAMVEKSPTEIPVERKMYPELKVQSLALSGSPLSLLKGLDQFFEVYPYLCTEQLLSKAVPALFTISEKKNQKKLNEAFEQALEVIRGRQTSDGGFALYPGGPTNMLVSVYVLHYLTEAKEKSLAVPADLLKYALEYAKNIRAEQHTTLPDLRVISYALYLQARNGLVPTNQMNYLKSYLNQKYKNQWEKDETAIFLAGLYKLLKQDEAGEKLLKGLKMGDAIESDYRYFYDSTVRDARLLMIAAKHYPQLLPRMMDTQSFKVLIAPLVKRQYNTYSSAALYFGLGALSQNAELNNKLASVMIEKIDGAGKAEAVRMEPKGLTEITNFTDAVTKFKVTMPEPLPLFYSMTENGFDVAPRTRELKSGIEISRVYLDDKGQQLSSVKLGDTVEVRVRVRSLNDRFLPQVAIVDLFPGGFEYVFEQKSNTQEPESAPSENYENGEPMDYHEEEAPPQEEGSEESYEGARSEWLKRFLLPQAYAQITGQPNIAPMMSFYADNREDRVVIYTAVDKDLREYVYKLKAVNTGRYTVPGTFGEDMYDRSVRYEGVPSQIKIEKR
ncbi:alpha-2-macroglobulin family protein [Bdellovibrio sp. HCB337]|uniref:alpha-2-macroglobulin family protein n=1 Tax=Bdellovibrio sp. HCB337 TaxID=3394358 RepID=UPI0039A758E7